MKNWLIENRFPLIISLFLYLIFQGFYLYGGKDGQLFSWMFLYMGILLFSSTLPNWKLLTPILIILQIPMLLLKLIHPFIQTFLMFIMLFTFSFGLLALLLKHFPEYPFQLDMTFASKFYILLITGSMILTLWGHKAIPYFNSIINSSRAEEKENTQLVLTLSIMNRNKIKFLIYIGFLIYLIPYSIALLSNTYLFNIPNVDKAVFNAFISYTAFERVLTNIDLMKIDWKSFFNKLFKAWM
jgi:hypothetical protein